jgi:hypothetical protein
VKVAILFLRAMLIYQVEIKGTVQRDGSGLKVLTNEKKGGLTLVLFKRSHFKLFTLKLSSKSVQSSSCERPKTAQRTLFLSFEINNFFQIAV